jgi:hypothetical protein
MLSSMKSGLKPIRKSIVPMDAVILVFLLITETLI